MIESMLATTRDALYGWTAERLVRKQTALGKPSYLYYFDHGYATAMSVGLYAFHASELPFVFGTFEHTPPSWPRPPATPQETALSNSMNDYWTSFARSGVPTAANQPDWPAYAATQSYMHFADTPRPAEHLLPGMYEFNETVVSRRREGDIAWNWNVGVDRSARCGLTASAQQMQPLFGRVFVLFFLQGQKPGRHELCEPLLDRREVVGAAQTVRKTVDTSRTGKRVHQCTGHEVVTQKMSSSV